MITIRENVVEGTQVGVYYTARILTKGNAEHCLGATIQQAVRNCLIKYGVTFR